MAIFKKKEKQEIKEEKELTKKEKIVNLIFTIVQVVMIVVCVTISIFIIINPGGYAEFTSCRPDLVKIIPDEMTYDEASMVEPAAVSLHAVSLADIKVGTKVLVIGGGIIGLMACEFAKLDGASYIAMLETNMQRAKKATTVGKADEYFDATNPEVVQELIEKTHGGFDVVIECCGNSAAVSEAIATVRPGGSIVLVGVSMNPVTIPTIAAVMGEVSITGAIAYTEKEFETKIINDIRNAGVMNSEIDLILEEFL